MSRKRWQYPLDLKTGRLAFSPVLRSTGQRLDLVVDVASFPSSKLLGFHGLTQDIDSGKWYAVYGKECDIPGCNCDAWVEEVPEELLNALLLDGLDSGQPIPITAEVWEEKKRKLA
jgi:hypothetical protein